MKHWPPFSIEPNALKDLNFPIEFLFVFALRKFMKKYEVKLSDIHIVSITFSRDSRSLENGEYYSESMKSAWITSDLKPLEENEMAILNEENCFVEMSKRFYKARGKTMGRLSQIDIGIGESIVEVYQDLSILFKIGETEIREWYSVPIGFCLYKARFDSRGF